MTGIPMINAAVFPDISRLAAPLTEWTSMAMSMFSQGSAASNEDFRETFKGTPAECQASILAVIESEIVPRLLGAQRVDKSHLSLVPSTRAMPTQQEIAVFLKLCIGPEPMAAQALVGCLLKDGLNTEHIFWSSLPAPFDRDTKRLRSNKSSSPTSLNFQKSASPPTAPKSREYPRQS